MLFRSPRLKSAGIYISLTYLPSVARSPTHKDLIMTSLSSFVRPFLPKLPSNQISFITSKPVSTPSLPGASQSFSIISRTHIRAPASIAAGTILIPSEWRKLNSYNPRCDVVSNPSDNNEQTAFNSSYLFGPANDGEKGQRMLSVGDEMKFYCNMSLLSLASLLDSDIGSSQQVSMSLTTSPPLNLSK